MTTSSRAGGITLPSKELYGHSNSKSSSAFFKYFSSVVSLLNEGEDDDDHGRAKEIRDVIDFERQLAGIMAREDNMTGMFVTIDKVRACAVHLQQMCIPASLGTIFPRLISRSILNISPSGRRLGSNRPRLGKLAGLLQRRNR